MGIRFQWRPRFGPFWTKFKLWRRRGARVDSGPAQPVCTENLNPDVVVMKAAEDGVRFDASGPLNGTRDRRVFVQ